MASTSERIWSALDAMPVRSGVRAAWREVVGDEGFRLLAPFLTAGATLAVTYPCDEPGDDGCPRGVVVHGPGAIEAVCRRRPRSCETLRLEREDVVIWRFDPVRLARGVRDLLALGGDGPSGVEGLPRAVALGTYRPLAGVEARAYLVLPEDPDDCAAIVERLIAREGRPFLIVVFTTDMVSPATAERLRGASALGVTLAGTAGLGHAGTLVAERPVEDALAPFRKLLVDAAATRSTDGMEFFPTPANATWDQVEIRFNDEQMVSVHVRGARGVFLFTQMGMADRRTPRPNEQWKLLRTFADAPNRTLDWRNRKASRLLMKRVERLVAALRRFFRIESGTPIAYDEDAKGWRAVISLSA